MAIHSRTIASPLPPAYAPSIIAGLDPPPGAPPPPPPPSEIVSLLQKALKQAQRLGEVVSDFSFAFPVFENTSLSTDVEAWSCWQGLQRVLLLPFLILQWESYLMGIWGSGRQESFSSSGNLYFLSVDWLNSSRKIYTGKLTISLNAMNICGVE